MMPTARNGFHSPALALLFGVLAPVTGLPAPATAASAEEYRVFKTYLTSPFAEKGAHSLYDKIGIYFIYNVDNKKPASISGFFKQYGGITLDPGLVARFVAVNRSPRPFDRKRFPADTRYSSQYLKADVYSLSRVGFNARGDQALLYASFASLTEDGHGSLVYLEKRSGDWTVVKAAAVWMYGASVHPFNP